jgi:hypothetical protein
VKGSSAIQAAVANIAEPFSCPLSYAQKRLWFLHQLDPESPAYHVPLFLRLQGNLNTLALERALNDVIARHESLRTVFTVQEGEPVQLVYAWRPRELPMLDMSGIDEDEASESLAREVHVQVALQPFVLDSGPLLRMCLVRRTNHHHELLLTFHHIISDGWSRNIFLRDLAKAYAAHAQGRPESLAEPEIQYADFTAWQLQRLSGPSLQKDLIYWTRQLADLPVLEFPADYARRHDIAGRPAGLVSFEIEADVVSRLRRISQECGGTLFMGLLAAFQWLLGRYARQDDVAVATVVANRNNKDLEEVVGFFVNTLILRTNVGGTPNFRELLLRARDTTIDAYTHQELPFEKVVEELSPERNLGDVPFLKAMLVLQNLDLKIPQLTGLVTEEISPDVPQAKFDLMLMAHELEDCLRCDLEYAADSYKVENMEALGRHFGLFLRFVAAAPDEPIECSVLLDPAERKKVLFDWNQTERQYPEECLQDIFDEQVRLAPRAIALRHGDEELTYFDLKEKADRTAQYLRGAGAGLESRVAICMDRGVDLS